MWRLIGAAVLVAAIGCDSRHDEGAPGAITSTAAYKAAHNQGAPDPSGVVPSEHSVTNPGNVSGPGTTPVVTTTRPEAVTAAAVMEARREQVNNPVARAATQPAGASGQK